MPQGSGIENGLGKVAQGARERIPLCECSEDTGRCATKCGSNRELRQPVRGGDTYLSTGGLQLPFGGAHVGALLHEFGGKAQRYILGQME